MRPVCHGIKKRFPSPWRLVRKTPMLSFDEVKMEPLSLEEEQEKQWSPSSCRQ